MCELISTSWFLVQFGNEVRKLLCDKLRLSSLMVPTRITKKRSVRVMMFSVKFRLTVCNVLAKSVLVRENCVYRHTQLP